MCAADARCDLTRLERANASIDSTFETLINFTQRSACLARA